MTSPAPTCSLREHQMVMLELLHQVDEVCRRHDISYALFAGSMLGAVRHKGFIPWDDDLDLIFLRADYERFLTIAETELDPALYHVQREFSPHWPMQSSKLRRNDTTCLEKYYPKDPKMHRGIYIDIFPCDALSDNRFIALLQFLASKVVIAKALDARGYVTHSTAKKLAMVLTRLLPRKPFVYLTRLGDRQNTRLVHTFFGGSKRWEKGVFPRMWLEHTIRVSFEDGMYPIPAEYDALLTVLYGDYKTPSPLPERRTKAHAFFVDTKHSYLDYSDAYEGVTFEALTESIR